MGSTPSAASATAVGEKYVQYFMNLWNLHLQNAWNHPCTTCNTYRPPFLSFLSGTVECLRNLQKPPKPFPTLGCVNTFRTTHWPSGELLMGETEDPKNSPVVSPCLTMCGILLHAAARKCGTPVITSPCQQPSSPAHRVGSWCAGRSFGFDHLQCQLFGWLISVMGEWKSPSLQTS